MQNESAIRDLARSQRHWPGIEDEHWLRGRDPIRLGFRSDRAIAERMEGTGAAPRQKALKERWRHARGLILAAESPV